MGNCFNFNLQNCDMEIWCGQVFSSLKLASNSLASGSTRRTPGQIWKAIQTESPVTHSFRNRVYYILRNVHVFRPTSPQSLPKKSVGLNPTCELQKITIIYVLTKSCEYSMQSSTMQYLSGSSCHTAQWLYKKYVKWLGIKSFPDTRTSTGYQ